MKKLFVLLLILMAVDAQAMFPLPQMRVPLKTDVKVKSSRKRTSKSQHSKYGVRTLAKKDTTQKVFLSIEVRNMSARVIEGITISYHFYELEFQHSTARRLVLTRRMGSTEKFVPAGSGQLTIKKLKPLERKVVQTEPVVSSYRSTQNLTKFIPKTTTSGRKFGGYIVEYYVGGELIKRDASTRRLHEIYLKSIRRPGTSTPLKMRIGR